MSNLIQWPQLTRGGFSEQIESQAPEKRIVKALTMKQPYASLMLQGKQETRTRKTNLKGWVLICAGKKPYSNEEHQDISGIKQYLRCAELVANDKIDISNRTYGMAIAIGHLHNCRPMTPKDEDACFVRFQPHLFVWEFINVHPIIPFEWSGKLSWFDVDQETKKLIHIL